MQGDLNNGPEEWQCYHCISDQVSTAETDGRNDTLRINKTIISDLEAKESEKWKETVEEITNQRIVKAQSYLRRFKIHQRHSIIAEKFDISLNNARTNSDDTSIFNNADFPLKLAPPVTANDL